MSPYTPLAIGSDSLRVQVLPKGAALVGVRLAGRPRNLVIGFVDPANPACIPIFAGPLVGPVANRIGGGKVELDGQIHQMPLNEGNRTALHSGPDGLHAQVWKVLSHTLDTIRLRCDLAHGTNGLPGNRAITATYHVCRNALRLLIEATTDRSTPINIAAHPYWNLDGRPDVSGHELTVHASRYLPTDANCLPTGEEADVSGTFFDFRKARPVPLSPALDINYCLANDMRALPQPCAKLTGSDGTTLCITTTTPGLQVYNGAHLPRGGPQTTDGPVLAPYAGIALEPQHWPDALHHPGFPSILLRPDETYRQLTEYELS